MLETAGLPEIYRPIREDLDSFQELLHKELETEDPFLRSVSNYLLNLAGKQLRPALTILSARLCGNSSQEPIRIAMAVELLHTATLIHDDIIDGSMVRRNQPSLNAKWGNEVSIITGDHLYAKAFSIISSLEDPEINKSFATCARTMCEGEMKQVETRKNLAMNEEIYLEIVLKKTASLFQTACAAAGTISHMPPPTLSRLGAYGRNFGIAFQITDDCLDIIGEEETLGKKAGLDFASSDPTLPLIALYRELDQEDQKSLSDWVNDGRAGKKNENFEKIKSLSLSLGILDQCMETARDYARRASVELKDFPETPFRRSLLDLIDYILQRV